MRRLFFVFVPRQLTAPLSRSMSVHSSARSSPCRRPVASVKRMGTSNRVAAAASKRFNLQDAEGALLNASLDRWLGDAFHWISRDDACDYRFLKGLAQDDQVFVDR